MVDSNIKRGKWVFCQISQQKSTYCTTKLILIVLFSLNYPENNSIFSGISLIIVVITDELGDLSEIFVGSEHTDVDILLDLRVGIVTLEDRICKYYQLSVLVCEHLAGKVAGIGVELVHQLIKLLTWV